MKEKLRIGLVGAGAIVRERHYPALRDRDDVELVTVCNSTPESTKRAAAEFSIPGTCGSWQELVQRDNLDIVWIGTTPYLHEPISVAALENGKHVFCQARMARNLAEAQRMLEAAQQHPDLVTMLCPPPFGMKSGATFRRLLHEGQLGQPFHLSFRSDTLQWKSEDDPMHWRQDEEVSGQNMLTVGIFLEVIGTWLGLGYPETIRAELKIARTEQAGRKVRVPDIVHVLACWPQESGGWQGNLSWSGVAAHGPATRLELFGSKGTLALDFSDESVWFGKSGEPLEMVPIPESEAGKWDVEERFLEAVRSGGAPEPSFETGVRYMAVLDAIHRSAQSGARCTVIE
jgi:predicted dehydrogenase